MNLGPDQSGQQMMIPNLIRAVGQALVFPPITLIATAGIPPRDSGSASSLFNMLRNLGGAIGIAVVQTFITNREKFHSAMINPSVSLLSPETRQRMRMMQNFFAQHGMSAPAQARHEAIIALGRAVTGQAYYFAYGDAFALLGCGMVLAALASLFIRKAAGAPAPGAH
jgi:DHA2 family multidrug resistance protein